MFPFYIRPKTTLPNFTQLIDKMNSNQLTLEDILDNDDLISDLKTNTNSQFLPFFSDEIIKKLIDYSTKMPSVDSDQKHGHKYPFNATEILCSDNIILIEKIFNENNPESSQNEEINEKKEKAENEEENDEEILPVAVDDENDVNKEENNKDSKNENNEEKKEDEKKEEEKKEEEKKDEEKKEEEKKDEEKKEDEKKEEKKEEEKKEDEKKEEKKEEEKKEVKEEKENEKKEDEKNKQIEENKAEETNENKKEETKETEEKNQQEETKSNEKNEEEKKEENKKEEESKVIYDNLDYFFNFLNTEPNDDNYVLIGYFYRIINHLFSLKGDILIKYIYFSKPNILKGLIRHLNRKAISEVVNKLITYEDNKIQNLKEKKISFINQIIKELSETDDELKYEWICDLFINTLNKKEFFFLFTENEDSIKLLYSILSSNLANPKKLKNILNVLIKLNETIQTLFENQVTPVLIPENPMDFMNIFSYNDNFFDEDKNFKLPKDYDFKAFLEKYFNILKENNFSFLDDLNIFEDEEIETPYLIKQKKLGTKKLAQIEFFRSILDILVNAYAKDYLKENVEEIIKLAEDKNIFWLLHEIFLKFEFNNLFQILYLQIITIAINKYSPEILVNSILINSNEKKNLIHDLIEHSLKSLKFKYKSEVEIKSGFFPAEIQILNDIFISENPFVKKLIEKDNDLKAYNEILANEINGIFKQKLLFSESSDFNSNNLNKEQSPLETYLKSFFKIVDENVDIYNNVYKKGEDYLKVLEEKRKKENEEKEKAKENQNENVENNENEDKIFSTAENDNLDNEKNIQREKFLDVNQKPNIENEETELEEANEINVMNKDKYNDNNFWNPGKLSDSEGNEIMKELL